MIILTILYLLFVAIVSFFVLVNVFKEKSIYVKIGGAILFVILLLRLFLIK